MGVSETTSIASDIYQGLMENGRRYFVAHLLSNNQCLPSPQIPESHVPADEQMFEAYESCHVMLLTLDSHNKNPLFYAPVDEPKTEQHILDIGTGKGSWAIDVADLFPDTTVRGVDLFPPPETWIPPNCILEVDDILQDWTWRDPFDLIHLRILENAFTPEQTDRLYKLCYDHTAPGGWIEQFEISAFFECDDNSLTEDSVLRVWGPKLTRAARKSGRKSGIMHTMQGSMEKAGFTDIHVKNYKLPVGPWPRDKQLKEAGTANFHHWTEGMEGYCMWLMTRYGEPAPWSMEEVVVYTAEVRKEISNPQNHCYQRARRIWARKPGGSTEPKIKSEPSP
ncbi:uncharacterized protein N7484_003057 [Penicillium longicatenatum]|uniref:uncharacterized protein n=1 Tax=Penicillium longicatenatum TaxID=1561947 RepID=UPI0025498C23|nr:uncharacterized protein N7484_003057 [Penicillium longicatenatum]KAJ5649334.1 hypothetical protein N7484_003057 [Penicillium longicatenatum]